MVTAYSVLIVEDEEKLAAILAKYLSASGFECHVVTDGGEVMTAFERYKPCMVLLDIMLPNVDGITLCKQIRAQSQIPIIMTTAKVEEIDRLIGLEVGADDYVCKPYSPREVVARVKAIMRRVNYVAEQNQEALHGLEVDEQTFMARFNNESIALTHVEFLLLKAMYVHPGRIFSRDKLMDHIYSDDRIVSDRTVDSHIKKLRKKLQSIAPEANFIHSIYGAGYKFEPI
ncbi:two-component system response regulator BaeR [Pseudoalteromonas phenolica]|uniref:Two-component system response regulator BaeR n=1 Tax=Pseudoalteromonas phenolica TaxID=161398 RepID=A0A5R9PW48_9GAMM|nr:response regulator [Pseudoalteromonas phenolica]TLX45130.1 two-component system response regulator BaeR [Pseudoalteromonas phenolica]